MRHRNWTVIVVSDDTESPRTLRLSSRTLRGGARIAGTALTGLLAVTAMIGMVDERRDAISADPAASLALLRDSITSLDRQTTALRVVAGLTSAAPTNNAAASLAPADANRSVELLIHHADQLSINLDRVATKLRTDADKVARTPSIMPTAGWLTSQFSRSRFHPILHKYLPHLGIDVAAPYGTTVVAPAAGTVVRVGSASGYGFVLEIDHGNGILTKYGHLSRFLVRERQQVVRGQPIAEVGNSGLATGPHLHYEVHVNGTIVDPLTYVLSSTIPDPVHQADHMAAAPED